VIEMKEKTTQPSIPPVLTDVPVSSPERPPLCPKCGVEMERAPVGGDYRCYNMKCGEAREQVLKRFGLKIKGTGGNFL
jgi:tRNA(Ile2) C34 agmatinyltransferase TiaS